MKSLIEQEIIEGKYYWDQIGQHWYRLVETDSFDVIGHVNHNRGWVATVNGSPAPSSKPCPTEEDARNHVEMAVVNARPANA